jgi:hypothetical protein
MQRQTIRKITTCSLNLLSAKDWWGIMEKLATKDQTLLWDLPVRVTYQTITLRIIPMEDRNLLRDMEMTALEQSYQASQREVTT